MLFERLLAAVSFSLHSYWSCFLHCSDSEDEESSGEGLGLIVPKHLLPQTNISSIEARALAAKIGEVGCPVLHVSLLLNTASSHPSSPSVWFVRSN